MKTVKPKKHLGQHFLLDKEIAERIVQSLLDVHPLQILEVGPGMGVLTHYIVEKSIPLKVVEIDEESVNYLHHHLHLPSHHILKDDFLKLDLNTIFNGKYSVIGNFPYNISSQIFFKILDYKDTVESVVGMLQKEVAERLTASYGNKSYGILSVLLQVYFDVEYLFTVHEDVFDPPPKVKSGVIRLVRNRRERLLCDETLFKVIVKSGFHTRRKTLRNALKNLNLPAELLTNEIFNKRAEQLSVEDFITLTKLVTASRQIK